MSQNLPLELILEIAEYCDYTHLLTHCDDQEPHITVRIHRLEIVQYSLVCKSWYQAFTPLLRRVLWHRGCDPVSVRELIRRCVKQPSELRDIRAISISPTTDQGPDAEPFAKSLPEVLDVVRRVSDEPQWVDAFSVKESSDGPTAELCLLLTLLPNLETLQFRAPGSLFGFQWQLALLQHVGANPHLSPSPRNIALQYTKGEDGGWTPVYLEKLFHLRQLKSLAIRAMYARGILMRPVRSSGIQHLTLKFWCGTKAAFECLLGAITSLQSIVVEWGGDPRGMPIISYVIFEQSINTLRQFHAASLETMIFDTRKAWFLGNLEDNIYPCGSFRELTALKHLELPGDFLLGTVRKVVSEEDSVIAQSQYVEDLLTWATSRVKKQGLLADHDPDLDADSPVLWDFMTDVFPPQLQNLHIGDYQSSMNAFGLRELWCHNFACQKKRRLPLLKNFSGPELLIQTVAGMTK